MRKQVVPFAIWIGTVVTLGMSPAAAQSSPDARDASAAATDLAVAVEDAEAKVPADSVDAAIRLAEKLRFLAEIDRGATREDLRETYREALALRRSLAARGAAASLSDAEIEDMKALFDDVVAYFEAR